MAIVDQHDDHCGLLGSHCGLSLSTTANNVQSETANFSPSAAT